MTGSPTAYRYEGEGTFQAMPRFRKRCDAERVIGEIYILTDHEMRSRASHDHFFAVVSETWANLPEAASAQFPSSEHLRKFALIRAGYADSQTFVANSRAEALRVAAFMRPLDEFAVVTVEGATVTRWTAQSQSMRAMGKRRFQESKDAVMGVLADMIDVRRDDLEREAGRAA